MDEAGSDHVPELVDADWRHADEVWPTPPFPPAVPDGLADSPPTAGQQDGLALRASGSP
jgi:hypothetical protein